MSANQSKVGGIKGVKGQGMLRACTKVGQTLILPFEAIFYLPVCGGLDPVLWEQRSLDPNTAILFSNTPMAISCFITGGPLVYQAIA